ncbi:MAG: CDP-alcohol phosphatidyltransferase family protein [Alphaproteobacteria bacterium]|nr:CDP-alcohol phosphatidyltransferase family protein [Alphaproteobacteria bacterium]
MINKLSTWCKKNMKLIVNSLTGFRIVAAFLLIPLLAYQKFWLIFILFTLAAASDFFDGFLAKKYNAVTKLGGVLDHIGDKLLITIASLVLAMFLQLWIIFIPVILMICRNLYVSGMREFLGTQKMEMPVPAFRFSWPKIATVLQMASIGLLFFVICLLPYAPTSKILYYVLMSGIVGIWLALGASLWSAWGYTREFWTKIKKLK